MIDNKKHLNLIGNSCVAAYISKDCMLSEFSNPFCWNIIEYDSMYNLIKYYDSLNFLKYTLEFDKNLNTYDVIIDNKVRVKFIHYKQDDNISGIVVKGNNIYSNNIKQYVIEKYEERTRRMIDMKIDPIFLIAAGYTLGYYYNDEQLLSIIDILSKYQIIISYDKCNVKPNDNTIILNHSYRMNVDGVHQKMANYIWNEVLSKIIANKKYFSEIVLLILARNEKDFKDWIHWHLNILKFDHLTVFDNESFVNIKRICDEDDRIEYHYIQGFPDQYKIYNQYINNESKSLWVLPIDDDEYLYMKNFDNVNDMLKHYQEKWPEIHKLSLRWQNMFPKDALSERGEMSLMEFCTDSNEQWASLFDGGNKPVKTFVYTTQEFLYDIKTLQTHVPISVNTEDMSYMCSGERIKGNWFNGPYTDTDLKLLHFQYKSKEEWIWKCQNRKRVSMKDNIGYNSKRADIYKKMN